MKKNSCTPINPKKYSCSGLKKNSYKEFDNEKKFLRLENSPPPPPHDFSNGPSLTLTNCSKEILYTVIDQSKLELKRGVGVKRGKRTLADRVSHDCFAFASNRLRKTWLHEGFKGQQTSNKTSFCNSLKSSLKHQEKGRCVRLR